MSGGDLGYVAPMGDDKNGLPKPTRARFAVADNLRYLMANYQHGFLTGLTPEELELGLAKAVSAKTIRRIRNPYDATSPNLETIDILAAFFKVAAWDLIRPRDKASAVSGTEKPTRERPAAAPHHAKRVRHHKN